MPATAGEADGEPPSTAALPATKGRMGNCAVCDAGVPAKYRCPACSVASCSLACSKRHKISANDGAGCTGKRDRAAFKDIRDFTDADVVSDYRFLEEALLEKDRAKRWRPQHGSGSDAAVRSDRAPAPAKSVALVVQKAEARGVRLRRMPDGMTRRVANTTHYDRRRDLMRWRVEWLFRAPAAASEPASVSASTSDAKVDETTILRDALAAHLRPVPGQAARLHRLRRFVAAVKEGKEGEAGGGGGASELAVFLAQDGRPANDPRFRKLNLNETIRANLAGKTIVEFPTMHVAVLPEDAKMFKAPDEEPTSGSGAKDAAEA